MLNDSRFQLLKDWIENILKWQGASIQVASADASFRRYFRITHENKSFIAMDAPPDKEDTQPFIHITKRLLAIGVHAPEIIAEQTELGFLMLEDLGCTPYQEALSIDSADELYEDALKALIVFQQADINGLPQYDDQFLLQEMALMPEWFLKTHLGIKLNDSQEQLINKVFNDLTKVISHFPTGFVHRDYHSRNLMKTENNNPGIIDYQDAVSGPLCYDLVSLLRDCYVLWPQSKVREWALLYKNLAVKQGLMETMKDHEFLRQMDLMGLQRHIKVLGIFSRLKHRDHKPHYLDDLPLTLSYVLEIGKHHPETQPLVKLLDELSIVEKINIMEVPE